MRKYLKLLLLCTPILIDSQLFAQVVIENMPQTDGAVKSILQRGDTIIVGGWFSNIYKGDSISKNASIHDRVSGKILSIPNRINGTVYASASDGNNGYYLAGKFSQAGDSVRNNIAHIDYTGRVTSLFSKIGTNDKINCFAVSGDTMYIGGTFSVAGDLYAGNAVSVDTFGEKNFGLSFDGEVICSATDGKGGWFVGGLFNRVGNKLCNNLAHIDSNGNVTSLAPIAPANNTQAITSIFYDGQNKLYVAGRTISELDLTTLLFRSLSVYVTGGAGVKINALYLDSNILYFGGGFTAVNGIARNNMASLNIFTDSLTSWNPNMSSSVFSFARNGDYLYVGGFFSTVGGVNRRSLAEFYIPTGSLTSWDLGMGTIGGVYTAVVHDGRLYLGGTFTKANNVSQEMIASFILSNHTLTTFKTSFFAGGGSVNVRQISVTNGTVYVSGKFTGVGPINAIVQRINAVALDANTGSVKPWYPGPPDGNLNTICVSGKRVFIGGTNTTYGGQVRNRLAAIRISTGALLPWDPNVYNPTDPNYDPTNNAEIHELLVWENKIVTAGQFKQVGATSRSALAMLNNSTGSATSWSAASFYALSLKTICIVGNTVYTAGSKYNLHTGAQISWSAPQFTNGLNVNKIVAHGSRIYLAGSAVYLSYNMIALDTATGSLLHLYMVGQNIKTLLPFDSVLYLGGVIKGGDNKELVIRMDTSTGQSTSFGFPSTRFGTVYTLSMQGGKLFVGGDVPVIGGHPRSALAAFSRSTGNILPMDVKVNAEIKSMVMSGNQLFLAGGFQFVAGVQRYGYARINIANGTLLPGVLPASTQMLTLCMANEKICIGGPYLAIVDTAFVIGYNSNLISNGNITTLCTSGDTLFVGGTFTKIQNQSTGRNSMALCKISNSTLLPLELNPVGEVHSLFKDQNKIRISGPFHSIKNKPIANFATLFCGTDSINNEPNGALSILGQGWFTNVSGGTNGNFYTVGNFNTMFNQPRNFTASINFSQGTLNPWYAQANKEAFSIMESANLVLIGGDFSLMNGINRNHLAVVSKDTNIQIGALPRTYCKGAQFTVNCYTFGKHAANNVFSVQLSDSSGSFVNPLVIGTKSSINSCAITTTIPSNVPSGSNYRIRIVSTNPSLVSDNNGTNITISGNPISGFSFSAVSTCLNNNVFNFNDTSIYGAGGYRVWNFGQYTNDTSSLPTPSKSYNKADTFLVKLKSYNAFGCVDSSTKYVVVLTNPKTGFTINNNIQCLSGNRFVFSDTSSSIQSRLWDFGNSDTSSIAVANKSYMIANIYNVKLITKSANGCSDSLVKTITVYPQTSVDFSIDDSSQCKSGNNFVFSNNSNVSSGTFTNLWNLGNNDTSSQNNPLKSFTTAGSYTVRLVTTTNFGCKDSLAKTIVVYPQTTTAFSVNDSDQCKTGNNFIFANNSIVSSGTFTSVWAFGDNNSSSQNNPSHSYGNSGSFNVKLVTTTNYSCKDSVVKTILIYPNPTALFTTDSTQCLTGNQFLINNGSSGSPTSYHWSFGNSSTSVNTNPSVSYASAGNYSIRLVAQNSFGCNDTVVKNVRVKQNPATPVFTYSPDTVVCDNINIVLKTGDTNTRSWMKNGAHLGITTDSLVVTNSPGSYSLKVTNTENCDATSTVANLFFKPTPVKPIVTVSGNVLTSSSTTGNQWYNSTGIISGETGQTYSASSIGQYYTIVTLNGCPSPSSDVVNFPATGMASISKNNSVSVYPNPNNGSFTIVPDQRIDGEVLVKLFDLTGRIVFEEVRSDNNLSIQTTGLANGTYMLVIQTNDGLSKVKIAIFR
jgi:PKD repeat protein